MTMLSRDRFSVIGDCAACDGQMIETSSMELDDARHVQLRCQDCAETAELEHHFEDGSITNADCSGVANPEIETVRWIDCPNCRGSGEIVGCIDDICHGKGRCIHDGNDACPGCFGSGSQPRVVETDGGEPADSPTPTTFEIPTIAELDAMRVARDLSQRDLSRRAGMEQSRFNHILTHDVDPHVSTMRAFLDVLREIEPDTTRYDDRQGPKPDRSPAVDDGSGPGEQADQSQTVRACPECDSTGVTATVRDTTDNDYYCRHCSARFDSPKERERYAESGLNGLARKLDKAEASDVGEPMTDGGEDVVYYASGMYDVYHDDPDCRYLAAVDTVCEVALSKAAGFREPCGVCADFESEQEIVTDGGEDLVLLSAASRSSPETYHRDRGCQYLQKSNSVVERPLDSLQGHFDPCSVCAGSDLMADGGEPADVVYEQTDRDVEDLSKAALVAEWGEIQESLQVGRWKQEERAEAVERSLRLWAEMRSRTDAEPPECPECEHTRWSQELGEPKRCRGCGLMLGECHRETIDAVDAYWRKVRAVPDGLEIVTDGGEDLVLVASSHAGVYHRSDKCVAVGAMDDHEMQPLSAVPLDPCQHCATGDIDGVDGTVKACPECDGTDVVARSGGMTCRRPSDDYACRTCCETFDEPVIRGRRQSSAGLNGLAGRLDDADPDAVSADRAGEPMTDGGDRQ